MSLPVWERGLKLLGIHRLVGIPGSLPVWERGLKFSLSVFVLQNLNVAPRVGAWIEIFMVS